MSSPHEEPGHVVLGAELAAARAAEQRHVASGPSPIGAARYGPGAWHLWRWTESTVDDTIAAFVRSFVAATTEQRSTLPACLTMDDLYTILTFAKRRALAAIRSGDGAAVAEAFDAISSIDITRVDWRDVAMGALLAAGAARYTGSSAPAAAAGALARVGRDLAELITDAVEANELDLAAACGLRVVETPDGRVLFGDEGEPCASEHDLVPIVLALAKDLESEGTYAVHDVGVARSLPAVWLAAPAGSPTARALERLTGCAKVNGEPVPGSGFAAFSHLLMTWVAEAPTAEDAALIASAAAEVRHEATVVLGEHADRLVAVLVARSTWAGTPCIEDQQSLERFRPLLSRALRET
ncbi:MAG TPA: hypothetical protein VH561_19255 [Micromonosporaceae bacterium]|jgi:hypothetical protein